MRPVQKKYTICIVRQNFFLILILMLQVFLSNCTTHDIKKIPSIAGEPGIRRWYKGNTHTHARFSDRNDKNDIPEIAGWYKKAGYDFLLVSEHNIRVKKKKVFCHDEATDPGKFLMLCGLELTRKIHQTALGIESFIGDERSLQDGVNKTIAAGGFSILNHPWSAHLKASDFLKTKGLNHLEVFNGNRPKQTAYCEKLWDKILSSPGSRTVYAVASDDNHYSESKVGRGWIMVESPSLTKKDIQESIRQGNFYATTGIILKDYRVTQDSVNVDTENGSLISFISLNGIVVSSVRDHAASYHFRGDEKYIRVKITNEEGMSAWTQPVFIK
jgi:hypothetical protein